MNTRYGLILSGGEGPNGPRTSLVRIDAAPSDSQWHVMKVRDDGTNRCKRGLVVHGGDVVWHWDSLPSKAQRRRAVALLNANA